MKADIVERAGAGSVSLPQGFHAGGLHCGLKKSRRFDLGVLVSETSCTAAAVYTLNSFVAAPLVVTKESLSAGKGLRAIVVNSGNANACTGEQGMRDAREMRRAVAEVFALAESEVAVASTGVIGEPLAMDKLLEGISRLPDSLNGDDAFCDAILTTDTIKKEASARLLVDGHEVVIGGAAKGSGMIHPNMATMLAFVATDAAVDGAALQRLLGTYTARTFNMITVDGDTSTNDMLVVMANGLAGNQVLNEQHADWPAFAAAFGLVLEQLAKLIARDGEGATKLIEVVVRGAADELAARAIAKTVIGSSLVKSAVFGADANWGRIIAAVGRAGVPVNVDTVDIYMGDIVMLQGSQPVRFDEDVALEYLKHDDIQITVDLHMGDSEAVAWGCDLTYDYVRINAAYRT